MIDIRNIKADIAKIEDEIEHYKEMKKKKELLLEWMNDLSQTTKDILEGLQGLRSTVYDEYAQAIVIEKHIKKLLFTKKLEEIIE